MSRRTKLSAAAPVVDVADSDVEDEIVRGALAAVAPMGGAGTGDAAGAVSATTATNNVLGLKHALAGMLRDLPWVDRLEVVSAEPLAVDVNDDLKLELGFYGQALGAVTAARGELERLGIPHRRPDDYFAEMLKSDAHMQKIKDKILFESKKMGAVEARRKEKEAASFAKQVAASRAREKAREKAHTQDVLRQWRQRRGADTSGRGGDDAALDALLSSKPGAGGPGGASVSGHKRPRSASAGASKDRKFGFGGQKRFKKDNSAASSNSLRGFNPSRNKALPPGVKPKWGGGGGGGGGGAGGGAGGGRFGKGGKRMGKQARSAHRGKGRA